MPCRTLVFSATLDSTAASRIAETDILRDNHYYVQAGALNQIVSHVRQRILRANVFDKTDKLVRILNKHPGRKTVIFVNECRRCDRLAITLAYKKFRVISINGHV